MNVWIVLYRSSWVVLGILVVVLLASVFIPQINEYHALREKKKSIEEEIRFEEQMLSHLKRQQERLQYDPAFAERIAREEFGKAKPGETVFRFVDDEREASPTRQP